MSTTKTMHENYTTPVVGGNAGTDGRMTITRSLRSYAYAVSGNAHNPTPYFDWVLKFDDRMVGVFVTRKEAVTAARTLDYREELS